MCDPRKNALLKVGNKNDRIDARKLADLLRTGLLSPVYHGENGVRTLKELARSYLALNRDVTRVMNRLKAVYRSWAIPCTGQRVYAPRYRSEWLRQDHRSRRAPPGGDLLPATGRVAIVASSKYDTICWPRAGNTVRRNCCARFLRLDPIRAALLIALMQTPHRFRTKRQLWAYSGLALKTSHQRGIPIRGGPTETFQEAPGHPRTQRQPQSRSEKYLQGCGDPGRCRYPDRSRSSTPL